MFSLIITILSIALVAVLALATLYYGGKAFLDGKADSNATTAINTATQISSALSLYRADHDSVPSTLTSISPEYLKQIPLVAGQRWDSATLSGSTLLLTNALNLTACQKFNQKMLKTTSVPATPIQSDSLPKYCFGSEANGYHVVWNSGITNGSSSMVAELTTLSGSGVTASGRPLTNPATFLPVPATSLSFTTSDAQAGVFSQSTPNGGSGAGGNTTPSSGGSGTSTTNSGYGSISHVMSNSANHAGIVLDLNSTSYGAPLTVKGKITNDEGGLFVESTTITANVIDYDNHVTPVTLNYNAATGIFSTTFVYNGTSDNITLFLNTDTCSQFRVEASFEGDTEADQTWGCS